VFRSITEEGTHEFSPPQRETRRSRHSREAQSRYQENKWFPPLFTFSASRSVLHVVGWLGLRFVSSVEVVALNCFCAVFRIASELSPSMVGLCGENPIGRAVEDVDRRAEPSRRVQSGESIHEIREGPPSSEFQPRDSTGNRGVRCEDVRVPPYPFVSTGTGRREQEGSRSGSSEKEELRQYLRNSVRMPGKGVGLVVGFTSGSVGRCWSGCSPGTVASFSN